MEFKNEIKEAIQVAAELYGTSNTISILGEEGSGWSLTTGGHIQSLETLITGYANAIEDRLIYRGNPFNGALKKTATTFSAPDTIVLKEGFGLITGDVFNITGSVSNDKEFTITDIQGNNVTVSEQVVNEVTGGVPVNVYTPEENLTIEQTLNKIQADIYDNIPMVADEEIPGTVKIAKSISKYDNYTTIPIEIKFNELITALRLAESMEEGT